MPVLVGSLDPTTVVRPPAKPDPLPEITPWRYADHFPGIDSITWTGWDGSTWDLLCRDPHSPVSGVALGRRIRGLHFPAIETYSSESPAVDGAAYLGYSVQPREVFLSLRVFRHTSSQDWIEHDRAFWRSMMPVLPGVRNPGRLTVRQPNGAVRWLELWPEHKGDMEFDVDPSRKGWCTYGQYFTAYKPFWTSDPIPPKQFGTETAKGFFGGVTGGKGAPFVISSSGSVGRTFVDVPGDEPAWPVWKLYGPFTEVQIGTEAQKSILKMDVAEGEVITIDTDPMAQTITNSAGYVVMPTELAGAPFASLPPGRDVPLVAEMTGTGRIEVYTRPLYHRAW